MFFFFICQSIVFNPVILSSLLNLAKLKLFEFRSFNHFEFISHLTITNHYHHHHLHYQVTISSLLIMDPTRFNTRVLKEPRGMIRLIQLVSKMIIITDNNKNCLSSPCHPNPLNNLLFRFSQYQHLPQHPLSTLRPRLPICVSTNPIQITITNAPSPIRLSIHSTFLTLL